MAEGVARALLARECGLKPSAAMQPATSEYYMYDQPKLWHEHEVTGKLEKSLGTQVDKAFAVAWQDDTRLLVGTKSNHLLQWDTVGGTLASVPLPPPPAQRLQQPMDTEWGSCGIHCVAVNPAGDMVATGGAEPADCVVLRLPDFRPVQTLAGHVDWLFGAAWISDRHVVTGSRDQSVALWALPEADDGGAPPVQHKAVGGAGGLQRKFDGKVRDVKYDFDSCRLAALSTEGCVKLLDTTRNLRTTRTLSLSLAKELVCMDQRADLLAVGSAGHVALLDPRRRAAEVHAVESPDVGQGVRSVQLTRDLLTFGTGRGKLFFYDVRAQAYVPTQNLMCDGPVDALGFDRVRMPRLHLELGPGCVVRNELFFDHFAGSTVRHACYAHTWDASLSRLFVCGGPLCFGLQGLYMAVWR